MIRTVTTPTTARTRRELTLAVLGCALGAGLVLVGALRTWAVEVTSRPAPLPPVTESMSGSALVPLLTPLGVVAFAGAAALLAARRGRPVVGALLVAVGALLAAASAYGWAVAGDGGRTAAAAAWPLASVVGGALVAVVGLATVRRGRDWPWLGARYERAATGATPAVRGRGSTSAAGTAVDPATLWDALDRGEDPTARP